jgi:hypothetical protein
MAGRIPRPLALGSLRAGDLRRADDPRHRRPPGSLVFLAATGIVGLAAAGSLFAACFSLLTRPAAPLAASIPISTPIRAGRPPGLTKAPADAAPGLPAAGERPAPGSPAPGVMERSALPPPTPPSSQVPPGSPPATATLAADDVAQALARGDAALHDGDLGVARFCFQQAADAGDGVAALRMGETFDPAFQAPGRRRGDARAASFWYRRALERGVEEAAIRLARLDAAPPR